MASDSIIDKIRNGPIRKPTDLERQIQVIGSGFGRTGTMSLNAALEILLQGPACHSGTVMFRDDLVIKEWARILRPDAAPDFVRSSLKSLLAGYVAVTDTWAATFTPEMLELFPDAIVICTVRDPESWYKSFSQLEAAKMPRLITKILLLPTPIMRYFPSALEDLWTRVCRQHGVSPPRAPDGPEFAINHVKWIKKVVPPERLHFFSVKDGWEPLCKILNVPIPDQPFPRANEQAAMKELARDLQWQVLYRWGLILGGISIAVGGIVIALKGQSY